MAEQLIDGMMTDWDPASTRIATTRDVMKIIEEKAKTGETTEHHAKSAGHGRARRRGRSARSPEEERREDGSAANDARPGLKKARIARRRSRRARILPEVEGRRR